MENLGSQSAVPGRGKSCRPFVDFYKSLDISPVKQDIGNLERHLQRREALYRFLGIPPIAVRGARVIEFGPGSGYNALYTASLRPSAYVLVDANPRGVAEMRRLFADHGIVDGMTIAECLIEDYPISRDFDLVLAEGLIVFQNDPISFAQKISSFSGLGGIVVVTCSDAISILSEIGRRLVALRVAPRALPVEDRLEILRPIFSPHLATLTGMSRSVDDWLLDNLIQPIAEGKLFSISDAIMALRPAFDPYGSSPRFLSDWRWYKDVYGKNRDYSAVALINYQESIVNMLDYRFVHSPQSASFGQMLLSEGDAVYDGLRFMEKTGRMEPRVLDHLSEICRLVATISPETGRSIDSLRRFLAEPDVDVSLLEPFQRFFGRGMQYMSFIRTM